MATRTGSRSHAEQDRPIARQVGARLRHARHRAGLTQQQLAEGRYTKAYVSALENGLVKPSMAALHFFADRLRIPVEQLVADREAAWTRLEADIRLATGDWEQALDGYTSLLDDGPPDPVRADLLVGLAEALSRLGRGQEAVRAASEAANLLRALGKPSRAAWATYWQASGLYEYEQGDEAAALLRQLLDEIASGLVVDPDLPVRILISLAVIATRDDEPERGLAYLEQARARIPELDDRKRAMFLFSLALSYRELGDHEGALATGAQSLALFRSTDAEADTASIQNELALVYLALGNLDAARRHVAEAREVFERRQDGRWLAHVTETQGQIALAAGSRVEAVDFAAKASRLAEESGDRKAAVSALLLEGKARRALGELRAAEEVLQRAAALAEEYGRRGQLQTVLGEWSDVLAELGDMSQAYLVSRRALDAGRR